MRRQRDRYLGRRSALVELLVKRNLLPVEMRAARELHAQDPYELRVRALDEKLTPHQFGRVLFHLNQRRGFKSNRKIDRATAETESGKIASGTKALDQAIMDADARTVGEFLSKREPRKGEARRVRMRHDAGRYDFYPDRKHYEHEFERIWVAQAQHHPKLLTQDTKRAVKRVIFFQRPLKQQVVGKCSFAGLYGIPEDETRIPKAHPLFQQRRLYEEVNQLEIVSVGAASRKLTLDERDALVLKLQDKKRVTFKTLGLSIKLKAGERFNKESENRTDLLGDEVRAEMMRKDCFGNDWPAFAIDEQWHIIDRLLNEEDTERLLVWLQTNFGISQERAEAISHANLPQGHGRFGITASTALLRELKADVTTYAEAAKQAGYRHSDHRTGKCYEELPYYGEILAREIPPGRLEYGSALERRWGKITNPTVHIGLNQLRKLLNAVVRKYGRPDYIFVELARELKLNEKQKAEHNRRIKQSTDAATARSKQLVELGERDSGHNRMKLRIWEQLNLADPHDRRCPYCGLKIEIEMLMKGSTEIDHIIPYSRCLDDTLDNKVICHTQCNRQKGNKTPWERWGETDRWSIIRHQVARLHKSKQWRFSPDAMQRVERDGGFIARQLADTQYLSRIAAKYLSSLYKPEEGRRVHAVTGRMTAMLRRLWGLNNILPDHNWVDNEHSDAPKNRLDHRHHAIDAAVVGATDARMIQRIATSAGHAEEQHLDVQFFDLPHPWDGFREDLRHSLDAITVSFKPDHGRKGKPSKDHDVTSGRLHNDTAYGLTGKVTATGVPIVVTRKPLLSLKPSDLNNLGRMPDRDLQDALYQATTGTSGKEFEKSLLDFAKREGPYKGIRRVRLTEPLKVIPIRDKLGRVYKAVKGDANARFDVWRMPDGKWITKWKDREGSEQSSIISLFDAHQRHFEETRPHPAAKKVLSLRQNDLLAIERGGGAREIMRVVKFSSNGSMQLAAHNEAGALRSRHDDRADRFRYVSTSAGRLKNLRARQIRIDELGHVHDPGPRD